MTQSQDIVENEVVQSHNQYQNELEAGLNDISLIEQKDNDNVTTLTYLGEVKNGKRNGFGAVSLLNNIKTYGYYNNDALSGLAMTTSNDEIIQLVLHKGYSQGQDVENYISKEEISKLHDMFKSLSTIIDDFYQKSQQNENEGLVSGTNINNLRAEINQQLTMLQQYKIQLESKCEQQLVIKKQVDAQRMREKPFNQDKYIGQFEKDDRCGIGMYLCHNQDKYSGFWKGKRSGFGTFTNRQEVQFTGFWKDGALDGLVVKTSKSSDIPEIEEFQDGNVIKKYAEQLLTYQKRNIQKLYVSVQKMIDDFYYSALTVDQSYITECDKLDFFGKRHQIEIKANQCKLELIELMINYQQVNVKCQKLYQMQIQLKEEVTGDYNGQIQNGKKYGLGTLNLVNGDVYCGWYDDLRNGFGVFKAKSQHIVMGFHKLDKLNGFALKATSNLEIEEIGEYENHKLRIDYSQKLSPQEKILIYHQFESYFQEMTQFIKQLPQTIQNIEKFAESESEFAQLISDLQFQQDQLFYKQLQICPYRYFNTFYEEHVRDLLNEAYQVKTAKSHDEKDDSQFRADEAYKKIIQELQQENEKQRRTIQELRTQLNMQSAETSDKSQ